MANDDHDQVFKDFKAAVNMTPAAIAKFLDSDDSKRVGQKSSEGAESVGHQSGRRIIDILHKKKADFTDDDYAHMKKVSGYVARHCKQGPAKDEEHSDWRYSLMNWGHDPLK